MKRALLLTLLLTFGGAASAGYVGANPNNGGFRATRLNLSQLLQSGRPMLNFGHPPGSHQRGAGLSLSLGAPGGLHLDVAILPAGHLRIASGDLELLSIGG